MMRAAVCILIFGAAVSRAEFVLASPDRAAPVLVGSGEAPFVRIAANDLVADVRRISGRTLPVVSRVEACDGGCVMLASADAASSKGLIPDAVLDALQGKREAFVIQTTGAGLMIAGSDARGTMFGLYDFIERELGVDPMYWWTGYRPQPRKQLAWPRIDRAGGEPDFRHRGWFINDEDLLAEWKEGGGPRDIDYPYYAQVTAPEVLDRVFETMVRLKFNLVIPASFTDVENPAEARMAEAAVRRGLMVSMHHVEPMGVSAFAFSNYWRARGRKVQYSYSSNPEAFHEVWRHYARRWTKYPGVIWQVGLRGIADRPVWMADPTAPRSDEGRGAMISRAIAEQVKIIREVDPRPDAPITTTLWMEGAYLFAGGHLKIPKEVTIVFADNNPGWKWQGDFHDTRREEGRSYGVYYHHAVWGQGPHLVQAAPPWVTHARMREAAERNNGGYAIFNVSNVREFVLGIEATSRMTWRLAGFDPQAYLDEWSARRFGQGGAPAAAAYRKFFEAFVISETRGTPDLLDGLALHEGERIVQALLNGRKLVAPGRPAEDVFERSFRYFRPVGEELPPELLKRVRRQLAGLDGALEAAGAVKLEGEAAGFFDANLRAQAHILRGICRWTAALAESYSARESGRMEDARRHAREALAAFGEIRAGQELAARGEFRDWYRGDRKMDLRRAERWTRDLLEKL